MNLRDALARKARRETTYDLVVTDPTEAEAAFETAERDYQLASIQHDEGSEQVAAVRARRDEARAALSECAVTVKFQNLKPDDFEALINAHPPTKEQQAKGDSWNSITMAPALVAACAVDSDLEEKEWADELSSARWSVADRNGIFMAALSANITPRSISIPRD